MKVIDKNPDEGAPAELEMHEHDARHAASVDPERYEIVPKTTAERRGELRARMSLTQRVAALESLLDEVIPEEELARLRRARSERAKGAKGTD